MLAVMATAGGRVVVFRVRTRELTAMLPCPSPGREPVAVTTATQSLAEGVAVAAVTVTLALLSAKGPRTMPGAAGTVTRVVKFTNSRDCTLPSPPNTGCGTSCVTFMA